MRAEDCWLWPEGSGIRWLTTEATGTLAITAPAHSALSIKTLRDSARVFQLSQTLAPPLSELLERCLQHNETLRLHLCRELGSEWHDFPYEWLSLAGQRLFGRLVVTRYAPCPRAPRQTPRKRALYFLNLWPNDEVARALDTVAVGSSQILDGASCAELFLARTDLTAMSALAILSHGNRQDSDQPFRLPQGEAWSLPIKQGMPALVILLACGNDDGNLIGYGRDLLAAGAQTVIAPLGRLDADDVRAFIDAFMPHWIGGQRVDDALLAAQRSPAARYGARSLRLLGQGDLRIEPATVADWPDETLLTTTRSAQAGDAEVTQVLAEWAQRLTFRSLRDAGMLEPIVDQLYNTLAINYDDPAWERRLLEALDARLNDMWPITQSWVLSYLEYLAESYDQRRLPHYAQAKMRLKTTATLGAFGHYTAAKRYTRNGRYGKASEEITQGLIEAGDLKHSPDSRIGLLGLLTNVLIDMDLPEAAQAVYGTLEQDLALTESPFALVQRRNLLDRKARLELRLGHGSEAIISYQRKIIQDKAIDRNPVRGLAWLLYVAAWVDLEKAANYAQQVQQELAEFPPDIAKWDDLTPAYLIRAYALWAWRSHDHNALQHLERYFAVLEEGIGSGRDPGAFAYAIGYLHLLQSETDWPAQDVPSWEAAQSALEAERHWLALAVLNSLMGRQPQAERFLACFHTQRDATVQPLHGLPKWGTSEESTDWGARHTERSAVERSVLLKSLSLSVEELVASGLLPL